jgi:hypothetical protein
MMGDYNSDNERDSQSMGSSQKISVKNMDMDSLESPFRKNKNLLDSESDARSTFTSVTGKTKKY